MGFFLFCLDLELLTNLVSLCVQKPGSNTFPTNTSYEQNKKNPTHAFVDIMVSRERVQNFSKNY